MRTRPGISFLRPLALLGAACIGLFACSPTRRLQEGQYLLVANKVVELHKTRKGYKDDIADYVQQKPNRKILGISRFYLQLYNIPDPVKLENGYDKSKMPPDTLMGEKPEKDFVRLPSAWQHYVDSIRTRLGHWLQDIGEPPTLLDSFKIDKSVKQLTRYARNKGYFDVVVRDSVSFKKKKATVHYLVDRGEPYKVDSIFYRINNPVIHDLVMKVQSKSGLKPGMRYDLDEFDDERDRLTRVLRMQGFYLFRKDFIRFEADTQRHNHRLNLTMIIDDPDQLYLQGKDTIEVNKHKQFLIKEIYIIPNYQLRESQYYADTVHIGHYHFLYNGKLKFNPKILAQCIIFDHNQLYNQRNEERTQRSFSEMRLFKYIHIRYEPVFSEKTYELLNVYIELSPTPKQNLGVDLQGTNTEGNLGVSLALSYQNKNIFKGGDLLEFRVTTGAEIQVLQGDSAALDTTYQGVGPFNTFEAGAQLSLLTPRFLFPIPINKVKKWAKPKTRITLAFNYQIRPDYERWIGSISFGYEWTQTNTEQTFLVRHIINPIEVSVVSIQKDSAFSKFIDQVDDQFVRNSFRDHFIPGASYTFLYNNQDVNNPLKDFFFIRANAQIGGNLFSLFSLIGNDQPVNGSHTVFNIPYSQFARFDVDFRFYARFTLAHSIATRAYIGVGVPYGNSTVLPFEKSFYAGGANDLRAWLPRTLGPGSYQGISDTGRIDQVGDMKILVNAEYRFKIYRFIEGALFADFGNIWLVRKDVDRPNGEFAFDRFWNEFALGSGVGLRLNFNFFIFRVDVALPMRDPTKPAGERWVIAKLQPNQVRVNIGIGYPF